MPLGIGIAVLPKGVHALLGPYGSGNRGLAFVVMGGSVSGAASCAGERIDGLRHCGQARRGRALAWQEPARFEVEEFALALEPP